MKKVISILFICLILLNVFGFNLMFSFLLYSCNRNALEIIKKIKNRDELTLIFVPDTNHATFQRVNKKEIRYKGKMYDVVTTIQKKDGTYYYCFDDEDEDKIDRIISSFHKKTEEQNLPDGTNKANYILNNLIKNYIAPHIYYSNFLKNTTIYFRTSKNFYQSPFHEVLLPPPKQSIS